MASKIPGGVGTVKLDRKGMRELMKSQQVRAELVTRMMKVQSALPGSKMEVLTTRTRLRVKVIRGSDFEEANTGDLSRALDLAGGERGTKTRNQLAKARARRRAKGYET
jgi:hypothetical protein